MYIEKRYPFWGIVNWSRKYIYIFLAVDGIPILAYKFLGWHWLAIPWQPIALIGIAVSFYLGFKNNSAYDRMWEARKIWGGIVNASRTFTVMTRDFITNEQVKTRSSEELREMHKSIIYRHVAWMKALTYQLRQLKPWEHSGKVEEFMRKEAGVHHEDDHFVKLKPYLGTEEFDYLMTKGNKASHLLSIQSKELLKLKMDGHIENFRHIELERMIGNFFALQGKSERIKNFPLPRQYATINFLFVWIFLLLLPFGMLNVFNEDINHLSSGLLVYPFSLLVSWVFILMELIGDYSENPFEGLHNDVPISTMARDIEIDIREMLDETDLPKPLEPVGQYQIVM